LGGLLGGLEESYSFVTVVVEVYFWVCLGREVSMGVEGCIGCEVGDDFFHPWVVHHLGDADSGVGVSVEALLEELYEVVAGEVVVVVDLGGLDAGF
jgi:hypothetical protein